MIYIVTAANELYIPYWFYLHESAVKQLPEFKMFFYDLGCHPHTVQRIKQCQNVTYELFDFSKYQDWMHIDSYPAGQWAWKPVCIEKTMDSIVKNNFYNDEEAVLLWCDTRNLIVDDLTAMKAYVKKNGIHTSATQSDITKFCMPQTIQLMNATHLVNKQMRNAALPCFDITKDWIQTFIHEWSAYAQRREVIAPDGAHRENNRQDQSILTILFYLYEEKYHFETFEDVLGVIFHVGYPGFFNRYK